MTARSLKVTLFFFCGVLLLCPVLLLLYTVDPGVNGEKSSTIRLLFGDKFIIEELWSPLSDVLGVVIGVPVALAGSVVAIYIAHQSYLISTKQEQNDKLYYIDGLIADAAERFWSLSEAFRALDSQFEIWRIEATSYINKNGDEGKKIALDDLEASTLSSIGPFNQKVLELGDAILSLLRNPIARQAFEISSSRSKSAIGAAFDNIFVQEKGNNPIPILQLGNDFEQGNIHGISYGLTKIFAHKRYEVGPLSVLLSAGNNAGAAGRYRINPSIFSIPNYKRILALGALISIGRHRRHDDEGHCFCNIGAVIICEISRRYPSEEDLRQAVINVLRQRGFADDYAQKIGATLTKDRGISHYFPQWLADGSNIIMRRPSKYFFTGGCDICED